MLLESQVKKMQVKEMRPGEFVSSRDDANGQAGETIRLPYSGPGRKCVGLFLPAAQRYMPK
jgi:hypothetical protein